MLNLTQRLSQQQRLSPQQIQYQKLLQLNTLALEQRIKTELEINPVLEEIMDEEIEITQEKEKEKEEDEVQDEYEDKDHEEFDLEDFMNDGEYEGDRVNKSKDDEVYQPLAPAKESLTEHLRKQLRLLNLDDDYYMLGEEIIGNLDNDGYLTRDLKSIVNELNLFEHVDLTLNDALLLLKKIQKFDPVGIASRDLRECLLVQLENSNYDQYYKYLAKELLENYFDDFKNRRFEAIKLKMNLTDESLRATSDLILKLNPKPGEGNIESIEMNQITPDFLIEKVDDNFVITLNDRSLPSVTLSRTYLEMISTDKKKKKNDREKNTYKFLREKFESAKWFIACIQQRRETLMKIMRAIVEKQYEFFERGPKCLRPDDL